MDSMRRTALVVAALLAVLVLATGCAGEERLTTERQRANDESCGGGDCHDDQIDATLGKAHSELECVTCHPDTGDAHRDDPEKAYAKTDWTVDGCGECHEGEAQTYLFDDNSRIGIYNGSVREPPEQRGDKLFPHYNTIVAGHAFAKDYREEGAHRFMLQDHMETLRGKSSTCVQCKSTKVAYAWNENMTLRVEKSVDVTLTHTATKDTPAKVVKVPEGTKLTFETNPDTGLVTTKMQMPDGTNYQAPVADKSDDATLAANMIWAGTIASADDVMPYGAGCNHCHDPHSGQARLVRQALIRSVHGEGITKSKAGANPYEEETADSFASASAKDKRILLCAQCHVEYTCGKSSVDDKTRDTFGWAKAGDLHELYKSRYDYQQDWRHAIIGEPLIKSQHPETELYWSSVHYDAGATCQDCHMPEIQDNRGNTFRSHWMTSPFKYADDKQWRNFAENTGVDPAFPIKPCQQCHGDRTKAALDQQTAFYKRQGQIEKLLAESVGRLGNVRKAREGGANVPAGSWNDAVEAHQKAHVLWENIAVSENSMGFHNFDEAMTSMDEAEKLLREAIALEKKMPGGQSAALPVQPEQLPPARNAPEPR